MRQRTGTHPKLSEDASEPRVPSVAMAGHASSRRRRTPQWRRLIVLVVPAIALFIGLIARQGAEAHSWVHTGFYHYLSAGFSPDLVRPGQGTTIYVSYAQKYNGWSHVAIFDPWGNRVACSGAHQTSAGQNRTIPIGIGAPGHGTYEYHAYIVASTACPGSWNGYAGAILRVDGQAPSPPSITVPSSGEVVRSTGVTVQGKAEAGSVVRVRENGAIIGTASTGGSGDWITAIQFSGGDHTINATAVDSVGNESGASPNRTFTVKPEADPPRNVYATAGNRSATVSWEAPLNPGNSAVVEYTITSSPDLFSMTVGPTVTSTTMSGLTNGITYRLIVTAKNGDGVSASSVPSNPVTPYDPNKPPPPPSDPHAPIRHNYGGGTKSPYGGEPVNLATGNLSYDRQDFSVPGFGRTLEFSRSYNSREPTPGALGFGWSHSYSDRLLIRPDRVVAVHQDGKQDTYLRSEGGFNPSPDVFDSLVENADGSLELRETVSKTVRRYDAAGRMVSITDRDGNMLTASPSAFDDFNSFGFNQKGIERVESAQVWTAQRGAVSAETNRVREGSGAIQLIDATATRPGLNLDLWEFSDGSVSTPDDFITAWVYIDNPSDLRASDSLILSLKTQPDAYLKVAWQRSELQAGWNRVAKKRREFIAIGETPDWASITEVAIEVWPDTSRTASVVVDDLRMVRNMGGAPFELGPTYELDGVWEWDEGRVFSATGRDSVLVDRGASVSDGTVGAKVRYELLGATEALPGIVARRGSNGYYFLKLEPTRLVLGLSGSSGTTELASAPGVFEAGRDYWLRLNLEGSTLRGSYSIDGKTFLEGPAAQDSSLAEGAIGLLSQGGGRNTFDEFGLINYSVTAANGQQLTFIRSSGGHVRELIAPGSRTMSFGYDTGGNLTSIVDFAGGVSRFEYDDEHQMTSMTSPAERLMLRNTYDSEGRVISQKDGVGNELRIEYDTANRKTTLTDARGNSTVYSYDTDFRLINETDPSGGRVHYSYDSTSQFSSVIDKRGNSLAFDYSGPKLNSVADPTGEHEFVYDAQQNLTQVTDALGRATNYEYDASGRPTKATDALGKETLFEFDSRGQITKMTDALGGVTTYQYNGLGQLVEMKDPKGGTTRLVYDPAGNVIQITDARGSTTIYAYDTLGRPTSTTDAEGHIIRMTYDADGNLTEATDAKGNKTTLKYDGQSNLIEVGKSVTLGGIPKLLVTKYEYDEVGNRVRVVDPAGSVTKIIFDALNRPMETITPTGARWRSQFDGNGNQIAAIDPLGNETTFAYDAANRLTAVTDPAGNKTTLTYDRNGNLVKVTRPDAAILQYEYDALDRILKIIDETGAVTQFGYDSLGRVTSRTDPNGNVWSSSYDALGLIISETDPLGNSTTYEYDSAGNPILAIDAKGRKTEMTYDALGQLKTIKDALGGMTGFEYDENGNRTSVTDALGRKTQHRFDELDRLVSVLDALSQTTSYEFDDAGNLIKVTDAAGHSTTFEFDADARRISAQDALGRTRRTAYDASGRVTSETNGRSQVVAYIYDSRGNLTKIDYPDSPDVDFAYDSSGRRIRMDDRSGPTRYAYDAAGRLQSVKGDWEGLDLGYTRNAAGQVTRVDGTVANQPYDANFVYDAAGRLSELSARNSTASYEYDPVGNIVEVALGNGTGRQMHYDALDRITEIKNIGLTGGDETTALTQTYRYDAVGNTIARRTGTHLDESFGYDSLNRLVKWSHGEGLSLVESYGYDPSGNRIRQVTPSGIISSTFDAANQLIAETGLAGSLAQPLRPSTHAYDGDGNRVSSTSPTGDVTNYEYDSANRPTRISGPQGLFENTYDGDGNRLSSTHAGVETRYSNVEDSLLGISGDVTESYVWGAEGLTSALGADAAATYLYPDAGGSISLTAGSTGAISSQTLFDPFGNKAVGSTRGSSRFGFVGAKGVLDETNLVGTYQMGRRSYDPRSGSFLSRDSVLGNTLVPQGFNGYSYAFNNPFAFNDATGNWPSFNQFKGWVGQKVNNAVSNAYYAAQAVKQLVNKGLTAASIAGAWVGQQVQQKIVQPAIKAAQLVFQKAAEAARAVKNVFQPPKFGPTITYQTVLEDGRRFNPNTGSWELFSSEKRILTGINPGSSCASLPSWYLYSCRPLLPDTSLAVSVGAEGGVGVVPGVSAGAKFNVTGNPVEPTGSVDGNICLTIACGKATVDLSIRFCKGRDIGLGVPTSGSVNVGLGVGYLGVNDCGWNVGFGPTVPGSVWMSASGELF